MRAHTPGCERNRLARMLAAWMVLICGLATLAGLIWAGLALAKESQEGRKLTGAPVGHNELRGGHGSDRIVAGRMGDVIWGDYKGCCQPTTQVDYLYGGPGNDYIYASRGMNYIRTGGGRDVVDAHLGRGEVHCESDSVQVYLSQRGRKSYRLFGCRHVSYKTEAVRRKGG